MKNTILGVTIGFIISLFFAFTIVNYELKNNTAEVEQSQGVFLFTDSKPLKEYEYLGTVKALIGFDAQYTGVRDKLLKKMKNKYPNADGIIFRFNSAGADQGDAIRFK